MTSIIVANDGREYQKPSKKENFKAVAAAGTVSGALTMVQLPFVNFGLNKMRKINLGVDTVEISKGLDKALDISKMKAAGVEILEPEKRVMPLSKSKLYDKFIELNAPLVGASRGRNAVFLLNKNKIVLRKSKMGTAGFHELGHAINKNSSKFWKVVQKMRIPGMVLTSAILFTALFKRKKAEGEEPKGIFDKTTTFVKENAGKLSLLAGLPVFAEEMMASFRGNKLAKQVLSPELYNKVLKTNKWSALIYASGFLATGLIGYLTSKTRDAVAKPKEIQS